MKVTISYQTLHLPPPFAFAYTLELDFQTELLVNFQLEYLNRDALTEEEIIEEGFSLDDKFSWSGALGPVWSEELKDPVTHAKLQKETEEANTWIHFDIENKKSGLVTDPDEWDYRLQELIQAVYEKSGHESPLQMKFIDRNKAKSTFYELHGSFATRSCTINKNVISWQQMQNLMSEVFSMEFEEEWIKNPEEDGLWINPDGISGYQSVDQMAGKRSDRVKKNILKVLQGTG